MNDNPDFSESGKGWAPTQRPDWCPHMLDCNVCRSSMNQDCVGRMETPQDHGEAKAVNTHRFCMDTRETGHGIFDLQVNNTDLDHFRWLFDAVDGKYTSWRSHDPLNDHKCEEIARVPNMGENREMWMGKLLEPLKGEEVETHCIHIRTPIKEVVWGIIADDLLCYIIFDYILRENVVDMNWIARAAERYRKAVGNG